MRFFVFLLISQQPLMQAGQHGHAHAQTHTHTGPMRRTQTNDSEDTYKVSVWSGGSCGTGTEDSWEMVGLGGGCFKWTWDEDMGSFMPHCNGTDEKVLVRTYYSSLDCTGPPSGSDSVPKTYLSEPSCWMYEWDGDILHEKLDRPVLPQHLPSCMVKPEDAYKVSSFSDGSCGTGIDEPYDMIGLGGGCFAYWGGSSMAECSGTDEKMLVWTDYSSLDCTGPPSGSDSVPKTYLSEPSCWMYEWDGDILHEKLDRPVLPQHLPSCMVKPRDESMTCGELKDMYKQAGCCGNPNKELKVPDSRRMASSDPENLLEALRTALDEVKLTQGPKAAADLAAQVLRSVRSP
eukprot:TRINITY_DN3972_c0_g1_i1.p1 TRINITY_DN3972_c0_g1~~TRINITY_DN3972_c0_g1_i1.p1  ORF type:complete len:346 (-),score=48.80 TRINITY_DN3972_c0_g1_i1:39-1076(-)